MRATILLTLALATAGAAPALAHHAPTSDTPEIDTTGLAAGRELAKQEWGQEAVCGGTLVVARLLPLPDNYLATYSIGSGYDQYQDPARYRDCTFDMNDQHPEWYRDPYTVCRAVVHESGHLTARGHTTDDTQPMGHGEYAPCRERFPRPAPDTQAADIESPPVATSTTTPTQTTYVAPKRERLYGKRRCSRAHHHRRLHRRHVAHKHERRTRCYRVAL